MGESTINIYKLPFSMAMSKKYQRVTVLLTSSQAHGSCQDLDTIGFQQNTDRRRVVRRESQEEEGSDNLLIPRPCRGETAWDEPYNWG